LTYEVQLFTIKLENGYVQQAGRDHGIRGPNLFTTYKHRHSTWGSEETQECQCHGRDLNMVHQE